MKKTLGTKMKIALLGDIGLFGKFNLNENNSLESYFKDYNDEIKSCDYVIGNLEVPFSKKLKEFKPKSAVIGSHPDNVKTLKMLNITHVNLANNHVGDFGKEGYELTKKLLKDNNIEYFGIEGIQKFIKNGNNKVCLSGFCNMNTSPVYLYGIDNKKRGVNIADADIIEDKLTKSHLKGYLNIFAFHTGLEHVHIPGKEDILFSRYLANKFPYILYGHHPHVVQGFERYLDSELFYSLGNFCFDDVYSKVDTIKPLVAMSDANKLGLIPIITIENNEVESVKLIWTYLDSKKMTIIKNDDHPLIQKIKNCMTEKTLESMERERNIQLANHLNKRKNLRKIKWYLNRLNFRYAKLYLEAKKNSKLYEKSYLSKVSSKLKGEKNNV